MLAIVIVILIGVIVTTSHLGFAKGILVGIIFIIICLTASVLQVKFSSFFLCLRNIFRFLDSNCPICFYIIKIIEKYKTFNNRANLKCIILLNNAIQGMFFFVECNLMFSVMSIFSYGISD